MYICVYVYLGECSWVCWDSRKLPSLSFTHFPSDGLGRPPLGITRLHNQSPRWDWTQDHEVAKHRRYHWTTKATFPISRLREWQILHPEKALLCPSTDLFAKIKGLDPIDVYLYGKRKMFPMREITNGGRGSHNQNYEKGKF